MGGVVGDGEGARVRCGPLEHLEDAEVPVLGAVEEEHVVRAGAFERISPEAPRELLEI